MDDVKFTREIPENLKPRAAWMINAIRFMRIRGWLSSSWAKNTKGLLEGGKVKMPVPHKGSTLEELSLSEGMKDIYHAASDVKPRFDTFVEKLMKVAFPKAKTHVCQSWLELQAKVDKDAETRRNAVVASAAELDAVDAAVVIVPLKDRDRTLVKSKEAYGGHVNRVKDIVRASIVCKSDEDIAKLISELGACTTKYQALGSPNPYAKTITTATVASDQPSTADSTDSTNSALSVSCKGFAAKANIGEGFRVVDVKNRFKQSAFNGYRDIVITIACDHVAENTEDDSGRGRNCLEPVDEGAAAKEMRGDGEPTKLGQIICEIQIHHFSVLKIANDLGAYGYYTFFRTFFQPEYEHTANTPEALGAKAEKNALDFTNKLKALKTMDQVGEFVEALEGAMQVYLGGIGRVGKDLPRLSAYFTLFSRVNEVQLAEAMQSSIIRQLREQGRLHELFKELSRLSRYFQNLKRYHHALPLSEEAMAICIQLHGDHDIETAHQLTNHANLLYCCENLEEAVPLFKQALEIKKAVVGKLHPLTYIALNNLAELYDDTSRYAEAYDTYLEVLSTHREIARNSRTGQAGPEVAEALVHLAQIEEITGIQEEDGEDDENKDKYVPPPPPKAGEEVIDPKVLKEMEEMAKRKKEEKRKGLFKKCFVLYTEALQIYIDFYGPTHEKVASVHDAVGGLRDLQGRMGQALVSLKTALAIREAVHKEACDYMGVSFDDYAKTPPHPCLCENYTRVGELLLDLGDVKNARAYLEKAVEASAIIALDEKNHGLCYGRENAFMALASAETALADCYLRLGGPVNYEKCRPLLARAYSTRMKYTGVRSHGTAHTMNLQGILDELVEDWKEELEEEFKDRKIREEEARKKKLKRVADYDMSLKVDNMAGTKTKAGTVSSLRDNQLPITFGTADSPKKTPKGRIGAALAFGTSVEDDGALYHGDSPSLSRANSNLGSARIDSTAYLLEEKEEKELTQEELDVMLRERVLKEHVHSKSVRDTLARQQIHARVRVSGELLETVDKLRDIGECAAARTLAAQAAAWLLPVHTKMDEHTLPKESIFRVRTPARPNDGGADGEEKSIVSESVASRQEKRIRDDSAQTLVKPKKISAKQNINEDTGGADDKLAMAVVLSQLGCIDEDNGYFHSAVDYFLQALQLTCAVYFPIGHHMYCTLDVLEPAIARATVDKSKALQEEVANALEAEEKAVKGHEPHGTTTGSSNMPRQGSYHHDPHEHHSHYGHPVGEAGTDDFCHDDVALCLSNLAGCLRFIDQPELSSGFAMLAREMYARLTSGDETDPAITKLDHMLALNVYVLGRHPLAFHYIDRALRNRKALYKTVSHPDYAAALNVKGIIEAALGKKDVAEDTMAESMRTRGKIFGTSDPGYALGTNSWAASMFVLDDLAHAGRVLTESFESRERQLGSGSAAVLTGLQNMAALFIRQQDFTNADPFTKGAEQVSAFLELQFGPVYKEGYVDELMNRLPRPKIKKRRNMSELRPGSREGRQDNVRRPNSKGSSRPSSKGSSSRPGSRQSVSRPSSKEASRPGSEQGARRQSKK
jgi:tetratricopeptide (TPR) repeat protein